MNSSSAMPVDDQIEDARFQIFGQFTSDRLGNIIRWLTKRLNRFLINPKILKIEFVYWFDSLASCTPFGEVIWNPFDGFAPLTNSVMTLLECFPVLDSKAIGISWAEADSVFPAALSTRLSNAPDNARHFDPADPSSVDIAGPLCYVRVEGIIVQKLCKEFDPDTLHEVRTREFLEFAFPDQSALTVTLSMPRLRSQMTQRASKIAHDVEKYNEMRGKVSQSEHGVLDLLGCPAPWRVVAPHRISYYPATPSEWSATCIKAFVKAAALNTLCALIISYCADEKVVIDLE